MTIQCCRCKKVRTGTSWTIPAIVKADEVSFSYCPVCLEKALDEIRAEREHSRRVFAAPHCFTAA